MSVPAWTAPQFPNMTVTTGLQPRDPGLPPRNEVERQMLEAMERLYRHARPVTYYPELPDGYPRN